MKRRGSSGRNLCPAGSSLHRLFLPGLRIRQVLACCCGRGDYTKPNESVGTAAFSDKDGGWTWTAATTPPQGFRSAVAYGEKSETWITVGPNGTDISTDDDGRNWGPTA